ncbi:MAG: hypothetical protein QOD86_128 [Miltoncostaeaceae bacterium]|nr:hypothetical protein [Miltoncostaeaceae bacterium]
MADLIEFLVELIWSGAGGGSAGDEPADRRARRRGRLVRLGLLVLILAALSSPAWFPGLAD